MAQFYTRPELALQTVQPLDPLEAMGKMASLGQLLRGGQLQNEQLRAARQENEMRARQMQEEQVVMDAQAQAGGDPRKFLPALQGKVSPGMYQKLVQIDAATREQLAKTDAAELATMKAKNDQFMGLLNQVVAMPDDQYTQSWPQIVQAAEKIHPGTIQQYGLDPAKPLPKQALGRFAIGLVTADQYFKQAEAGSKTITTDQGVMGFNPQTGNYDRPQGKGKLSLEEQQQADWLAKNPGKGPSDFLLWKQKNSPSAMMMGGVNLTPEALDMAARLYGQTGQLPGGLTRSPQTTGAIINRAPAVAPSGDIAENKINYETSKGMARYMTSGAGGKQLTAFNTAIAHLDTLHRLANDLNNTDVQIANRAKQAWAEQTGNPAPANFAAAVNAMSGEVAAALKASGATDQEIAHVGATFSRVQSPSQLKGAIGTYRELLKSKAQQLRRQYEAGRGGAPAFGQESNVLPRGNNQVIDAQTAQQFYAAAGGDPNKARQLAQQYGWRVQ